MAKNQRAAKALAAEFQSRAAGKVYLALLAGNIPEKRGIIDNYMIKGRIFDAEEAEAFCKETVLCQGSGRQARAKPQRAVTKFEVLNELPGVATWVRFSPMTGRTHQLRLHSAYSLQAPIVGDELYGKEEGRSRIADGSLQSLIDGNNLFLFAYQLTFRHPGTGKIMTLRAELPDFMRGIVKFLEFEVPG
jgi:23S rRNA-/tRNA-specific pseudouridylate synthase